MDKEFIKNPVEAYEKLKQECEELKKINKANAKSYEKFWYKLEKYKQTLAEIKEIAEKGDMPPCMEVDCNCTNCKDKVTEKGSRCMQYSLKQILQKISEVENVSSDSQ